MSDLRPDDSEHVEQPEQAELPPDLLAVSERLSRDGARWRRRAPDGARLVGWARETLPSHPVSAEAARRSWGASGAGASQEPLRERLLDFPEPSPPTGTPRASGLKGYSASMTMTRLRNLGAVAAAVLVVGLMALLLVHNAAQRSGPGASGAKNVATDATPATTPSAPLSTQYQQPGNLPVVSAANPRVAYRLTTTNALQRSADGGATYADVALPKTDLSSVDSASVAVSPLDASRIFVTLAGQKNGQGCLPPSQPYGALSTHGGVLASGYVPCAEEFMSANGGQTWTQLSLPTGGVLGGTAMMRQMMGAYEASAYTFQAQGQRIYAAIGFSNQGGALIGSQAIRLVASDDGGATWRLVDSGLATQSRFICDFAAAPTPGVLYAVTAAQSCGNESFPTLTLWRSDTGGQSWTRVRDLPTQAETGIVVDLHGGLYSLMPQVTAQGQSASFSQSPADVKNSPDAGATFLSAPSAGLPANPGIVGPYATLSDGSVVMAVGVTGGNGPVALYAWGKGQSAWMKISGDYNANIGSVTVSHATDASGATTDTLTVVDVDGNITHITSATSGS